MKTQFSKWLKEQKKHWIRQRGKRQLFNSDNKNSIQSILHEQQNQLFNSPIHILQIHETARKGIFNVWVYLENNSILSIKVSIPRVIYINQHTQESNDLFTVCKKKLPRGKKRHNLYECEISEDSFKERYHEFDFFLTNPDIEGVYETQIPLDFHFICKMGAIAKLDGKNIMKKQRDTGQIVYEYKDFRPKF